MYGNAPVLAAFINEKPAKAASLVAKVQKLANSNKRLKVFLVFQGGPELQSAIAKLAKDQDITIPLVFLPNGSTPAKYSIHPDAKNTFMTWVNGRVTGNFVDVTDESFAKVSEAAVKIAK